MSSRPLGPRPPLQLLRAFLWLGLALPALCQTPAFRRFEDRDGLPQSQVFSLLEDRDGFIWAGTAEGLARLGPSGIQEYGSSQGPNVLNINDLIQDRNGSIWAASQEDGVTEIRGRAIARIFPMGNGQPVRTVYSLLEAPDGRIYAGTRLGLFRREKGGFVQVELPGTWARSPIFAMGADPRGGIWLGSLKGALVRWTGTGLEPARLPRTPAARFRSIRRDPEGRLWALSGDALFRLEADGSWSQDPLPGVKPGTRLRSFQVTRSGELLLGLDTDGLYVRAPGRPPRILTYLDGLPRDGVVSVLKDSRGVLWLGTNGAGLLAQSVPGLSALEKDPATGIGLGLGSVLSFQELAPGRMLIGSSSGLYLWEKGRGITGRWDVAKGLPSNEIWTMTPHPGGGVWVGTVKGLARWVDGRILPGPKEMAKLNVSRVLLHEGRIWVATLEQGLAEMDFQGRMLARHPSPTEVGEPAILSILPRQKGVLVATRCGIYAFRDGRYQHVLTNTPVATAAITSLAQDPDGRIWVGTDSSGLYGFPADADLRPPSTWEHYGEGDAQVKGSVSWSARLPSGALAVGHGLGITLISPGQSRLITRNMGLISNETSESAVLKDSEGRLWIGMVGGVCILDSAAGLPPPELPRPRVLEAILGERSYWLPKALVLPPNPEYLQVRFDTGNPLLPLAPRYEIRIDGLDASWRPAETAGNQIQIAHLSPGRYAFRVRVSLDGRAWTESEPLPIQVRAAWYQTVLARLGLVAGAVLTGALLVLWRLVRAQRQAQVLEAAVEERTRDLSLRSEELALRNLSLERLHHRLKESLESRAQLMNTVSHDLRSPLTGIVLAMDRIGEMEGVPREARGMLDLVGREAQRAERILNGLLDKSRSEKLTEKLQFRVCKPREILGGLAETLRLKAQAVDLASSLDLDPREEEVLVLADTAAMQQVAFNLIENALKFTPAPGSVGISTRVEGGAWTMEVWDTGRGIERDKIEGIFAPFGQGRPSDAARGWGLGLSICQAMVEAHEGRIEVESEPGRGSRFRVVLPLVGAPARGGA